MLLERVLAFAAVLLCDLRLALSLSGLYMVRGSLNTATSGPYSCAAGAPVDPEGSRVMCVFYSLHFRCSANPGS